MIMITDVYNTDRDSDNWGESLLVRSKSLYVCMYGTFGRLNLDASIPVTIFGSLQYARSCG